MKEVIAIRDFEWILDIIKSCRTIMQLRSCGNMVVNFRVKYKEFESMVDQLEEAIINKQEIIHTFY